MIARLFFSMLLMTLTAGAAQAGAWLQPEGHGLAILQGTYYANDEFFDANGDRTAQPRYQKYELTPYVEYGLNKNLTIGGLAFFQRDSQSGAENYGVADPEIFLRSTLWQGTNQLISIQPLIKLPSMFERDRAPRGGSRSTDAELSLLYGRNLHWLSPRDYLDLRAGYRYRANSLNDQLSADLALGLEVAPRLQIIPAIRTIVSTSVKESVSFSENGDQDYDLVKLELGANYRLNATQSLGATAFTHIYGREVGNGGGILFSFAQEF